VVGGFGTKEGGEQKRTVIYNGRLHLRTLERKKTANENMFCMGFA
jgi:hypothetical protein